MMIPASPPARSESAPGGQPRRRAAAWGGPRCCWPARRSEGHAGAAVAQQAGQDAAVQLVELHELQQVGEAGLALVHAEVQAPLLLALGCGHRGWEVREGRGPGGAPSWAKAEVPVACAEASKEGRPQAPWGQGGEDSCWQSGASAAGSRDTHRQDKVMLDFLHVAQRQYKALWVPLTLSDQEQAARRQGNVTRRHEAAARTQVCFLLVCCPGQPCPLPVNQALLPDEPLALLARNASVEPRLGAVDGWGEGRQMGGHSGVGTLLLTTRDKKAQRSQSSPHP